MATKNPQKNPQKYFCNFCDYYTGNLKDYRKHQFTRKHKLATESTKKSPKIPKMISNYFCDCGKNYKDRSGLWRHKKKCNTINNNNAVISVNHSDSILNSVIQENNELLKKITDITTNLVDKKNTIENLTVNNINNNLNIFLDDYCKNAININDFIDNIQVSRDDLEYNAQHGFISGVTKIIENHLNKFDLNERPLHCTDTKRDVIYMKQNDIWSKDEKKVMEVLSSLIIGVSRDSIRCLNEWKRENPDYADMDSEFSQKCLHMLSKSLLSNGGDNALNKVMHKVGEIVKIDRNKELKEPIHS
jgi:hypothetical protein